MRKLKKQLAAFGLAAAMAFCMSSAAYAASYYYDPADVKADDLAECYAPAEDWYGCYNVIIPGAKYELELSPYWDNPDFITVNARRSTVDPVYGDDVIDVWWSGTFVTDPDYGLINSEDGDGRFSTMINWNGDAANPDVAFIMGHNPTTDEYFLGAATSDSPEMTEAVGERLPSTDAFPSIDDDILYKKISNAYPIRFYYDPQPDWYHDWIVNTTSPYITWDEQVTGQIPTPVPWPFDIGKFAENGVG